MKAWERSKKLLYEGVPVHLEDDNETIWEEQADGPEKLFDMLNKIHWHSNVPGSQAEESICTAAIQATENKGMIVDNTDELLERGFKAYDNNQMAELQKATTAVFEACMNARKDENSPYWNQKFYDSFEEYEKAVKFPAKVEVDMGDELVRKEHAGWLCQIIGGAFGTCIEGYVTDNIYKKYGIVDRYIRKPNTYNDDITYELALLLAYDEFGKGTTSKDIAHEWLARVPTGWSAEDCALTNLRAGILPPESGRFNNPFNEWIGAQMRGAICGQLYPGDPYMAAKCAWQDAEISHARNGILGEVFNAVMTSMAFYETDIRKIVKDAVELMPADSEYGQVVRFALEQCENNDDYLKAWRPCESKYDHYNWIHAYPNACAEIVALWFGEGDFTKTLSICGMCGQDVDCNAAQLITVVGIIKGIDFIPEYWVKPIGDNLDTYCRELKKLKISELAKWTAEVARKLV